MESSLVQRKPQAKPAAEAGEIEEMPAPQDNGRKTPRQPLHRHVVSWLLSHPEVAFTVVTAVICFSLLRSFALPSDKLSLFDARTLALYNGKKNAPLYLAILGEVFDVTKGRRHYGDGKGYGGFVGRDATRAFVTGDFTGDLNDDVLDFTPEQFKSLVEWRSFYRKEYTFKGRLVGRFFNNDGRPTRLLQKVEDQASKAKSEEEKLKEMEAQLPACSVRWTESEGGSVWCDDGAYPRKVFLQLPGGKPTTRCACFKELGWSDVRQVYPNCTPDAHKCKV